MAPFAGASSATLGSGTWSQALQARFDTMARQTHVSGRVASNLCLALSLPQEWRLKNDGLKIRLEAAASDAELEIGLRSTQELRDMPQPDLASRDAAVLQRDYEELLGRPAQSVSLASSSGATRWSATWIDDSLPTASHAMTVETFIVPLSNAWVLELSLSDVEAPEAYKALAQTLLNGLNVQTGDACSG